MPNKKFISALFFIMSLNFTKNCYIIYLAHYIFARVSGARGHALNLRKERTMENGKKIYFNAEIEVVNLTSRDIVTSSTAENFDYVDQNAWDS